MWRDFPQLPPEEFRRAQDAAREALMDQYPEGVGVPRSQSMGDFLAFAAKLAKRDDICYAVLSHAVPAEQAYIARDADGERFAIFSASIRDKFAGGGRDGPGMSGLPFYSAEAMPQGWPVTCGRFWPPREQPDA